MLKSLLEKKGVTTIIAAVICIVILFFAYRYRVEQKVHSITVPYAVSELKAAQEITEKDIGSVKVAQAMLTNNIIRNQDDLKGKYVNFNTFIPKGSLFYTSSVIDADEMPNSAWTKISQGDTVISLPIQGNVMFANAVYPGAIIDLYYQTYDTLEGSKESKLVYGKLIDNIKVLAIKDERGNHIFDKIENQGRATDMIFAVDEKFHKLLRSAMYLGKGSIVPVLRSEADSNNQNAEATVSSRYIEELILSETVDIPQDKIEDNVELN